MSLSSLVKAALSPVTNGRVYPRRIPGGKPTFPLIVYQRVGGVPFEFQDQSLPDKDNARVQVTVWAESELECESTSRAVRVAILAALTATTLTGEIAQNDGEDNLKLYGSRQDFGIWYTPA